MDDQKFRKQNDKSSQGFLVRLALSYSQTITKPRAVFEALPSSEKIHTVRSEKRYEKFRSILALLTAGAILACSACGETTKTSSHYRLVKSVTKYSFNQQTEEWEPSERTDYAYKNGYSTSIASTIIYEDSEEPGIRYTFQYTFDDNGQPVSAKISDGTAEKTSSITRGVSGNEPM